MILCSCVDPAPTIVPSPSVQLPASLLLPLVGLSQWCQCPLPQHWDWGCSQCSNTQPRSDSIPESWYVSTEYCVPAMLQSNPDTHFLLFPKVPFVPFQLPYFHLTPPTSHNLYRQNRVWLDLSPWQPNDDDDDDVLTVSVKPVCLSIWKYCWICRKRCCLISVYFSMNLSRNHKMCLKSMKQASIKEGEFAVKCKSL